MQLVHEEVHVGSPHRSVEPVFRVRCLIWTPPMAEVVEQPADQEHALLGEAKQVQEEEKGHHILGHAGAYAWGGGPLPHYEAPDQEGKGPDEEGHDEEDVAKVECEEAKHAYPLEAQYDKVDPEEVGDLRRQCSRHQGTEDYAHQDVVYEDEDRLVSPDGNLVRQAALEEGAHLALLAPVSHLSKILLFHARPPVDETVELLQVLLDKAPPGEGAEDDGRDEPRAEGNDDEDHGQLTLKGMVNQEGVHNVC
mmetsp:Transcript_79778/g.185236  ORF Transcript_79778/g.185236 Transcript_79778/m.185236 type:complete len:251 (+) Transcript_79778:513-1265(+)